MNDRGAGSLARIGWVFDSPEEALQFIAKLSPFHPSIGLEALTLPQALRDAVPAPNVMAEGAAIVQRMYDRMVRDYEGKNAALEAALAPFIARGVEREKLLDETNFPAELYQYVVQTVERFKRVSGRATILRRRLKSFLAAGVPLSDRTLTELRFEHDYLAGFPTQDYLKAWREEHGIDRTGRLWNVKRWRAIERKVVPLLAGIGDRLPLSKHLAGKRAFALLSARYPEILPADTLRKFLKRNSVA